MKKIQENNEQVTLNLPIINDWLDDSFLKKNNLLNWNDSIKKLHNSQDSKNFKSKVLDVLSLMKFVQFSYPVKKQKKN